MAFAIMVRCVMSRYIKLADALRTLADTCYLDEIDENMQKLPSIDIVREPLPCRLGSDQGSCSSRLGRDLSGSFESWLCSLSPVLI